MNLLCFVFSIVAPLISAISDLDFAVPVEVLEEVRYKLETYHARGNNRPVLQVNEEKIELLLPSSKLKIEGKNGPGAGDGKKGPGAGDEKKGSGAGDGKKGPGAGDGKKGSGAGDGKKGPGAGDGKKGPGAGGNGKGGKSDKKKQEKVKCADAVAYKIGWINWVESIQTDAPVFRPKSDQELSAILKAAADHNCVVRMQGATHSEDGVVMQRREENIIIIALTDHIVSNNNWKDNLNTVTGKVRIGAGKSFYYLMSMVRPQGFLMPTRTAGRFFSIGGVVANMVHGGATNGKFVHDYVTSMLVMKADGTISEISSTNDLSMWKCSLGMLGIILAVEFQLEVDTGLEMKSDVTKFTIPVFVNPLSPTPTELAAYQQFINDVTTKVYTIYAISTHSEFYYSPYDATLYSFYTTNSGITPTPIQKATYSYTYTALNSQFPDAGFDGGYKISIDNACDYIPAPYCYDAKTSAYILSTQATKALVTQWSNASTSANDGYFLTYATVYSILNAYAPSFTFPQIFSTYLNIFGQFAQDPSKKYYPNGVLEFRFLNPTTSTAVLNPIPPITDVATDFQSRTGIPLNAFNTAGGSAPQGYINVEITNIRNVNDNHASDFFVAMQNAWLNTPFNPAAAISPTNPLIPLKIMHLGKGWGYGSKFTVPTSNGNNIPLLVPFVNPSIIRAAYSAGKTNSIANFNAYRANVDPHGLFAGGAMLRWLKPSYANSDFEPRSLDGQSCGYHLYPYIYAGTEDYECISHCCDTQKKICLKSSAKSCS